MSLPLDIFSPAQAAILVGFAAVLGACLGSFVNCLAWRKVHGESVLAGRSHCTSCGHVLGPLDLVPIVSWLALRGRCRHCGQRVSARYVLAEALLAAVFAALLVVYGAGAAWLAYAALACVLLAVALVDYDTFTIPNGFVIAAIVVWLLMMAASAAGFVAWPLANSAADAVAQAQAAALPAVGTPVASTLVTVAPFGLGSMFAPLVGAGWQAAALDGLVGAVVAGGGVLVLSIAFDAVTGRTSLGGGDVKLLFAVGLFLGVAGSLLNLLVACIMGLAFALVPGLSRPPSPETGESAEQAENLRTKAIPFGPAIAAATAATLLFGPAVLTWYVGLF